MLVELMICRMALIEESSLGFGRGLNVITGETGAGKSLLVGALDLLLGQRPRRGMIRAGARQLLVEGRFVVPRGTRGSSVRTWLERHLPEVVEEWRELDAEEECELILGRTVAREGKNRAHVNHRPVTQKILRELAVRLVEIHGQNDHQKLLDPGEQLRLLDGFGKLGPATKAYTEARMHWLDRVAVAEELAQRRRERRDRLELARFQLAELEELAPEAGEREKLTTERDLLRHAGELQQALARWVADLSDGDAAVLDRLRTAQRELGRWLGEIESLRAPSEELEAATVHVEEAARALRSLTGRVELDPARLDLVESRLAELDRLERKHVDALAGSDLSRRATELRSEIEALERQEEDLAAIGPEIGAARARLLECGGKLRRRRKSLAGKLRKAVLGVLGELGLERADFDVRIGQRAPDDEGGRDEPARGDSASDDNVLASVEADRARFGDSGMDRIEFLLAANPGESMSRLRDVASGGETARIMLALRSVLVGADPGRTLVFDEIDSGVGGRTAPAVGSHLAHLAQHHQVLCVTHLPAVAAAAEHHLRVSKLVEKGRTHTRVEQLQGDARVEEVADMIGGGAAHETARAEARRLIG